MSKRKKIFVTRRIPDAGLKLLKKYEVKVSPHDRVLTKQEIIKMAKGSDALLSLLTDKIDGELMDAIGPQLKVISNYAVGFNNIDIKAAEERKIKVTNTPGLFISIAVAEHTFALMMAITQRIVEGDEYMRRGKYRGWEPTLLLGSEIQKKTLGIVGLGRIGREVAKRAVYGMDMKVVYNDIQRHKDFEKEYKAKYLSLPKLMKASDVVSIHVPLLPSTKHLIGAKELKLLGKKGYLVNTSRGPVIDEKALYLALDKKIIRGAAIDVYECEPKMACTPALEKVAKRIPNLIMTPHIASATDEARDQMAILAAKNVIAVLSGKRAVTPVRM